MTNERIGSFIAAVRKEKKLTQEQLAERLGVSNRSVSRWENGKTLPDLSLMEDICNVLDITISELLHGEKEAADLEAKEMVALMAAMAQREWEQRAKEVNRCLIPGVLLLAAGMVRIHAPAGIALAVLGMGLLVMGIIRNSRRRSVTDRELEVLAAGEKPVRMTTAEEMAQFARKYQGPERRQQRQAFAVIAGVLEPGEYGVFAMTGSGCQLDGRPGLWHVAAVLTDKRLLLCGEGMRGCMLPVYSPEWLSREEIRSLEVTNRKLVICGGKSVVTIEGGHLAPVGEKLRKLLNIPKETA